MSITNADMARLWKSTNGRTHWYKVVEQFKESKLEEPAEKLKDYILADFGAWSLLGSFLTSIAFSLILFDPRNSKNGPIDFIENILTNVCTVLFMYAALMSLHSVIAGTMKYLYFSAFPSTVIVQALCAYLDEKWNSGAQMTNIYSKNLRKVLPHKWDHMGPLMLSIYTICYGFILLIYNTTKNIIVTVIIGMFSQIFLSAVQAMRYDLFKMYNLTVHNFRPLENFEPIEGETTVLKVEDQTPNQIAVDSEALMNPISDHPHHHHHHHHNHLQHVPRRSGRLSMNASRRR